MHVLLSKPLIIRVLYADDNSVIQSKYPLLYGYGRIFKLHKTFFYCDSMNYESQFIKSQQKLWFNELWVTLLMSHKKLWFNKLWVTTKLWFNELKVTVHWVTVKTSKIPSTSKGQKPVHLPKSIWHHVSFIWNTFTQESHQNDRINTADLESWWSSTTSWIGMESSCLKQSVIHLKRAHLRKPSKWPYQLQIQNLDDLLWSLG